MTRTTGAADAQIEAAAERLFNFRMTGDANNSHQTGNEPTWKIVSRRRYLTPIHEVVDFIVTPDHRIVRVDDLRALLDGYTHYAEVDPGDFPDSPVGRIAAAIGEAE